MKRRLTGRILSVFLGLALSFAPAAAPFGSVSEVVAAPDYGLIFDAAFYVNKYPELRPVCGTDEAKLYEHYLKIGIKEGRQASAKFNPQYYRTNYPDLQAAFANNWQKYADHFLNYGMKEGRVADRIISAGKLTDALSYDKEPAGALATVVANPPDANGFLTTTDPAEITKVISQASGLTAGRKMCYSTAVPYPNSPLKAYRDDSILAVGWKESIAGRLCTFTEVVIKDGSQFRRKLTGDAYGSPIRQTASQMSAQVGAVVASTADFYAYRSVGTIIYGGTICRFDPNLDTCYITYDGDMLMTYAGQIKTLEEMQKYIADNRVNFGITFGPIIVDGGQARAVANYALGEINQNYSRCAIGYYEKGHFLIMTMNYEYGHSVATLAEETSVMALKGCSRAYAMDGGGTGEIVFGGVMYNRPDWNKERAISDIIYFVSGAQ